MTSLQQIERVQKLQNFASKVAYGGIRKFDHVSPIIKELEWLRIENKIKFDICVMVFSIVYRRLPGWLFSLPKVSEMQNQRTTRQSNNLFVPRTTTDIGKRKLINCKGA